MAHRSRDLDGVHDAAVLGNGDEGPTTRVTATASTALAISKGAASTSPRCRAFDSASSTGGLVGLQQRASAIAFTNGEQYLAHRAWPSTRAPGCWWWDPWRTTTAPGHGYDSPKSPTSASVLSGYRRMSVSAFPTCP